MNKIENLELRLQEAADAYDKSIKIKDLITTKIFIDAVKSKIAKEYWRFQFEKEIKLLKTIELCKSGYAGMLSNGNIVDRREFSDALPMPENPMFNTPKPKEL